MVAMTTRAIRGATSLEGDAKDHLHARTQELVAQMLEANSLTPDDVISVFFTCTPDIVSDFPAAAAREMGFAEVPLMCAVEMAVPTALPLVVRVMMHAEVDVPRSEVKHTYLHEAVRLRRDIAQ